MAQTKFFQNRQKNLKKISPIVFVDFVLLLKTRNFIIRKKPASVVCAFAVPHIPAVDWLTFQSWFS